MAVTTYISTGELVDYRPEAAVAAGDIVFRGTRCYQVVADVAAGQLGALRHRGVIRLNKASATVFADGAVVSWNGTTKLAVVGGSGGTVGRAVAGGADGQTFVDVLMNV